MINSAKIPKAYSEVYSFINALGSSYISKIPVSVYNTIKKNRDENYNPMFNRDESIIKSNISKEGLALISAINLQYWCNNEDEKAKLKKIYIHNGNIEKQKYSSDNLFNNINKENMKIENICVDLMEYKQSFLQKIIRKIKKIFRL